MKVLIACEESQTVCKAFRKAGHEAYSCDIQTPSGDHKEWHILGDALVALRGGACRDDGRNDTRSRSVGPCDRTPTVHLFKQCRGGKAVQTL